MNLLLLYEELYVFSFFNYTACLHYHIQYINLFNYWYRKKNLFHIPGIMFILIQDHKRGNFSFWKYLGTMNKIIR